MWDMPLARLTFADIERLLRDQVPEGRALDYKRDPYGNGDDAKKDLLKDVCALANTQGGHIVIGIEEKQGTPAAIPGVAGLNPDKEMLRLEQIIRQGLEPRVDVEVHCVPTPAGTTVTVIRVMESSLPPHRVNFQGKPTAFWARGSNGIYSMDMDEIRSVFTLGAKIDEKMRTFRSDRVTRIEKRDTPIPLMFDQQVHLTGTTLEERRLMAANVPRTLLGALILHLCPVSAFRSPKQLDLGAGYNLLAEFPPMDGRQVTGRLNADGYVAYVATGTDSTIAYTQFFRTGIVESVLSGIVSADTEFGKRLGAEEYEYQVMRLMPRLLESLRQKGIQPPIWGFLSLVGVNGAVASPGYYLSMPEHPIDRDPFLLPEFVIKEFEGDLDGLVRPTFELVWHASGVPRSPSFDATGRWKGRSRQ